MFVRGCNGGNDSLGGCSVGYRDGNASLLDCKGM